jgi:acetylornithine deacetylase
MDTVPPFFPAHVTSDKIFGRGAADNKGNLAGAIFAARQMRDINILFTVGEEQNFAGAKKANIKGKVVVMEPTNLEVRTGQCGIIAGRIIAHGDQKHSSLLGASDENALHVLVDVLGQLMHKHWHHFNVGLVKGGAAPNVVAGHAEAEFSVRPKNREEFSTILKTIRNLQGVKVQIINKMPPFESGLAHNYAQSKPTPFFSELAFFKKAVIFGAGDIAQAHTPTEFIYRKDLKKIPSALVSIARSLEAIP